MTIRTWSFYREHDGSFVGREYSAPNEQFLAQNTPAGCVAIEGRYDRERQRVDLQSKRVIDDDELARANAEKRSQQMRGELAQTRIDELERKQARRVRELLAANDPQLKAIDDEIAGLRATLRE